MAIWQLQGSELYMGKPQRSEIATDDGSVSLFLYQWTLPRVRVIFPISVEKVACCRLANRSGDSERMLVGEE
jgi:hypothetical protein